MAKVLLADDSDLDRELTVRALRRSKMDIQIVEYGDGVSAQRGFAESDDIGLVLLDHRMPLGGAEEFLRSIGERSQSVPVVLFSSAVSPANVKKCLELGAREFVEKPTDPSEYGEVVVRLAKQYLLPS